MGPALRWDHGGKILAIWRTLQANGDAIEADLQRFYGIRLAQVGTKELTWRHLGVLIEHLPSNSATRRVALGDDYEWTLQNQLLAALVDGMAISIWQRGGDKKAKRPKQIPRPGVVDKDERKIGSGKYSMAEVDRILAGPRHAT